jgi:hypothetical protein
VQQYRRKTAGELDGWSSLTLTVPCVYTVCTLYYLYHQLERTQRATARARRPEQPAARGGSLAMGGRALRWGPLPALLTMMTSALSGGAHSGSIKPLPPPPPPDLNGSVVVFSAGLGDVPNYRIPAIVQTTGSPPALVAFAEARNGSDFTTSRIAVRTSIDAGDTWSAVTFAAGVCSPPVLVHREGEGIRMRVT